MGIYHDVDVNELEVLKAADEVGRRMFEKPEEESLDDDSQTKTDDAAIDLSQYQ
jgi:hypothetical protein